MSRILIAGCGYVGSALARRLVASGHEVHGLRRRPVGLPPGVIPVAADLGRPESLGDRIPAGLDAVVYAVAAGEGSEEAYRAAYLDGVVNLLEAAGTAAADWRRFLFVSSTGVHPESRGEWVDEETPVPLAGDRMEPLVRGEALVLERLAAGTVVRFSGIYGPGRTRLLRMVRDGRMRRPREPRYTNRIHLEDCAGVLHHLLDHPSPPRLLLASDDEPADLAEVIRWAAEALGVPIPPFEDTPADSPFPGGSPRGHKRCRNDRLRSSGYRFRFPTFREGYTSLLPELENDP